jgi:hypothetical protein
MEDGGNSVDFVVHSKVASDNEASSTTVSTPIVGSMLVTLHQIVWATAWSRSPIKISKLGFESLVKLWIPSWKVHYVGG